MDKEAFEEKSKELKEITKSSELNMKISADDPFTKLIGYNGSLKTQVKLCKSAAL
ncbi:MAG: hypothetical protein ACPLRZ_00345 [Thermovenabulum sp.]|uniref:hypothetical protein n=1 Tax=Thermovenabulum sp. TaxID=3100335 RepID=UPI003C7C5D3B